MPGVYVSVLIPVAIPPDIGKTRHAGSSHLRIVQARRFVAKVRFLTALFDCCDVQTGRTSRARFVLGEIFGRTDESARRNP